MKKLWLAGIPLIVLLVSILGACGSSGTTTSTTSSTPSGPTAGGLAASGKTVYAANCAQCHGANGEGVTAPTVIGTGQALAKYNTAQELYNFISTNMPFNNPGTLSSQQYLELTAFLLVQNSYVQSGQAMDSASLAGIALK
jgi:alcohol dehydrogenase (cytochrome c)